MLARAGAPVTLIGRSEAVGAINRDGLTVDSLRFHERVPVAASTDVGAARDADMVLLSVKTVDTEDAARALAPVIGPNALVVSLQNGVDNVERMRKAGVEACAAVVYVAAEITAPGTVKHVGRGDLIVGVLPRSSPSGSEGLAELAALLTRAGVPCRVADDIEAELWTKMILNCAYNAISALARARYGRIPADPGTREVMRRVIDEAVAVATADGVRLPDRDFVAASEQLSAAMPNAFSSTAQDVARGKRTEIDSLNGYLARRGAELGVATPVNETLHALVKLLETGS